MAVSRLCLILSGSQTVCAAAAFTAISTILHSGAAVYSVNSSAQCTPRTIQITDQFLLPLLALLEGSAWVTLSAIDPSAVPLLAVLRLPHCVQGAVVLASNIKKAWNKKMAREKWTKLEKLPKEVNFIPLYLPSLHLCLRCLSCCCLSLHSPIVFVVMIKSQKLKTKIYSDAHSLILCLSCLVSVNSTLPQLSTASHSIIYNSFHSPSALHSFSFYYS